jgi:hypothetical protein
MPYCIEYPAFFLTQTKNCGARLIRAQTLLASLSSLHDYLSTALTYPSEASVMRFRSFKVREKLCVRTYFASSGGQNVK